MDRLFGNSQSQSVLESSLWCSLPFSGIWHVGTSGRVKFFAKLLDNSPEIFHGQDLLLKRFGELARDGVGGDADRLLDALERKFDDRFVPGLAEQETRWSDRHDPSS